MIDDALVVEKMDIYWLDLLDKIVSGIEGFICPYAANKWLVRGRASLKRRKVKSFCYSC